MKFSFCLFSILAWIVSFSVHGQDIRPDALYKIVSPSGLVIDNDDSFDDNSPLRLQQEQKDKKGQLWKIDRRPNGLYTITNPYTDKNIDNGNIHGGNGNRIIQWMAEGNNRNQQWKITVTGTGAVQIESATNGMSLGIPQEEKVGAFVFQLPNSFQVWRLVESDTKLPKDFVLRGEEDWQNETVFAINKMKGHTTFIPYSSTDKLKADAYYEKPWLEPHSDLYQSLNGPWKFKWSKRPEDRPMDFWKPTYSVANWEELAVPACWESNGYGTMIYTNIRYPFANRPPFIQVQSGYTNEKEPNPVGAYRRDFTVPAHWNGSEVILHFDGVYSGFYVWVNGKKIGYSEGANNVAEFNITSALQKGKNTLAIEVYKWTDGSYLEDQDMFRFGGIHRDVYLYALPKTHILDYHVETRFEGDDFEKSTFLVNAELHNLGKTAADHYTVLAQLLDADGQEVLSLDKVITVSPLDSLQEIFSAEVVSPTLWSAETPYLYTLVLSLQDNKGKEIQVVSSKVGFRKVEIKNKRVYVNGKQVFFKGVNRHDTHPEFGKTIPTESMVQDVLMMKQHNINTLRTSHYPNHPKMYAILDYYGLYTMDEADIENHGNHGLSDRESWRAAYIDRMERMMLRDRNHPSVIFWSMGNESGGGENFDHVYARAKEIDPSRPIHYEGKNSAADIDSHMYPSVDQMERFDQRDSDKPYFLCEYAHTMGNALGNLYEYWDYIENRSQRMIGACIWDWADQAHVKMGQPKDHFYFGGQFGESPHDGDFSNNGLTTPDRRVTAKLLEVKKIYQYIKINPYALQANKIELYNTYDFTNINQFFLEWHITREGEVVQRGTLDDLDIDPDQRRIVQIPFDRNFEVGQEYHLNVYLKLKEDHTWEKRGHVVASEQFQLTPKAILAAVDVHTLPALTQSDEQGRITVSAPEFSFSFDAKTGDVNSIKYGDREILHEQSGPVFNWYRSVNNDKYTNQDYHETTFSDHMVSYHMDKSGKYYVLTQSGIATIHSDRVLNVPFTIKYTIYGDGKIDIDSYFTKPQNADIIRRLGLQLVVAPGYQHVHYFGHGPHENYSDRIHSAHVGRYETTVQGMEAEHYVRAQSMGNREGIRWLSLVNDEGKGLKVTAKTDLNFSALHFTDEAVWKAENDFNLSKIRQPQVYLNLDARQQGLGNASCGPLPLLQYMLPVLSPVFYSFRIEPLL